VFDRENTRKRGLSKQSRKLGSIVAGVWWIRKGDVVYRGLEPLGEAQRITPVNRHAILHLQGLGIRLEGRE